MLIIHLKGFSIYPTQQLKPIVNFIFRLAVLGILIALRNSETGFVE